MLTGAVTFQGEDGVDDIVDVSLVGSNIQVSWLQPATGTSGSMSFPVATTPALIINTFAGDDILRIDNSGGLVDLTDDIFFNGGTGRDQLILTGSTVVDAATYDVGPNADEGRVTHALGGASMDVFFTGLEPALDSVVAASLTVNATNRELEAKMEDDTWILNFANGEVWEVPLAAIEGG